MRDLLLVLGVGRSGTSALTRVLSLCGAHLPAPLIKGIRGNVTGHFEPATAMAFNTRFLRELRLTWHDPTFRLQTASWIPEAAAETLRGEIAKFLNVHASLSPLVVKEPRITALTRYWLEEAERAGWRVKIIIAVRHPHEVRESLATRDGISRDLADALWLKYNFLAEQTSRPHSRIFVDYAALLQDWRCQLTRIADTLDIDLPPANDDRVAAFLDRSLRHHAVPDDVAIDDPWLACVHAELVTACAEGDVDRTQMDRLYSLLVRSEAMFRQAHKEVDLAMRPIGIRKPKAAPLLPTGSTI